MLKDARSTLCETEEVAADTHKELLRQGEQLRVVGTNLEQTNQDLGTASRILTRMKNKWSRAFGK